MSGHRKEAMYYFDKQTELYLNTLKLDPNDYQANTYLAGIYSFLGDSRKALRIFNVEKMLNEAQRQDDNKVAALSYLNLLKSDPLFENLRKEPSFQEYLKVYSDIYSKDHDRLQKWLAEQGKI